MKHFKTRRENLQGLGGGPPAPAHVHVPGRHGPLPAPAPQLVVMLRALILGDGPVEGLGCLGPGPAAVAQLVLFGLLAFHPRLYIPASAEHTGKKELQVLPLVHLYPSCCSAAAAAGTANEPKRAHVCRRGDVGFALKIHGPASPSKEVIYTTHTESRGEGRG